MNSRMRPLAVSTLAALMLAAAPAQAQREYDIVSDKNALPHGPCVVVGTSAKWGMLKGVEEFDILFVDEAWQLSWADFMLLGQVSARVGRLSVSERADALTVLARACYKTLFQKLTDRPRRAGLAVPDKAALHQIRKDALP